MNTTTNTSAEDHGSIRINPKQWITNPDTGHALLVHRYLSRQNPASFYSLVGGTNNDNEHTEQAARRLLADRVGLETDLTKLHHWWMYGITGQLSIRVLLTGESTTPVDHFQLGIDDRIISANWWPVPQIMRMVRSTPSPFTDSTLVAVCRVLPELIPHPRQDDVRAVLFEPGLLADGIDPDDAEDEAAAAFGVQTSTFQRYVDRLGFALLTGLFGDIDATVQRLAITMESPVAFSDTPVLRQAWLAAHQMTARQTANDVLTQIRGRGVKTAVVGNLHEAQLHSYRKLGFAALLNSTVVSAHTQSVLPDPNMVRRCLEDLKVPAEHALYVTDSLDGALAAITAGVPPVLIGSYDVTETGDPLHGHMIRLEMLDLLPGLIL